MMRIRIWIGTDPVGKKFLLYYVYKLFIVQYTCTLGTGFISVLLSPGRMLPKCGSGSETLWGRKRSEWESNPNYVETCVH